MRTASYLRSFLLLSLAAVFSPAASATDAAHAAVTGALAAMGSGRDLHALAAIRRSGVTANYDIVEFDHADAPYVFLGASRTMVTDDLRGDRRLIGESMVDATADTPARQVRTLLTHDTQYSSTAIPGRAAIDQALEAPPAWETDEPIRALLMAEHAGDLSLQPDTVRHGLPQHVIAFHHGRYPVRIFIDALSGLPSAIETVRTASRATSPDIAWNAWGDLRDVTELMNYVLDDGVRYPSQSDLFRNGVLMRTAVFAQLHWDDRLDAGAFSAVESGAGKVPVSHLHAADLALGQPIGMAPDPAKPIADIAPGIVQIPGSWYATIVRQDDGLVIIDAPISSGYSARVLAEAARRFPGMPVKALITSTAFYWHIAGIRTYAARGIPIYVRDRNVPVVRALLDAPHALAPDELSRAPGKPMIRAVAARTQIGHGTNAVEVLPVTEGEQPMIMTRIASAHLLHTGEMVQPLGPGGALLYPESLLELEHSVRAAGIPTGELRLIGMHMSPTPWATLERTLHGSGGG